MGEKKTKTKTHTHEKPGEGEERNLPCSERNLPCSEEASCGLEVAKAKGINKGTEPDSLLTEVQLRSEDFTS